MSNPDNDMTASELTHFIWDNKYRYRNQRGDIIDQTLDDTWRRVARVLASAETTNRNRWENRFYDVLKNLQFIPGGRILAGTGVEQAVTLFNCFVMGDIRDPAAAIIKSLRESATTLQQGGGIGCDFSLLAPRESVIANHSRSIEIKGPISNIRLWNDMCASLASRRSPIDNRRGALMATLRCDHPDIEDFIDAKKNSNNLNHVNLSVLVTDEFMVAVEKNTLWPLVFADMPSHVFRRIPARELWQKIMQSNYDYAEPGVLFIDRINQLNNLWYRENIHCTNPCGEVPLPSYGTCDLGSINLASFVREPFSLRAHLDMRALQNTAMIATRMLDNVIDLSAYPLREQKEQAKGARRLGLGITGLADALIQLGLHYGEPKARDVAADIMKTIRDSAYHSSIELAREKGAFPFLETKKYLSGKQAKQLPEDIRAGIEDAGIRNSHLTAIAPAGSISLLAGNVSNGIEPLFGYRYQQQFSCSGSNTTMPMQLTNFSYQLWLDRMGPVKKLPEVFVRAHEISPDIQLKMVSALQPYVDNAISKTVNVSPDIRFPAFSSIFSQAYKLGLKGCSTFHSSTHLKAVISGTSTTT